MRKFISTIILLFATILFVNAQSKSSLNGVWKMYKSSNGQGQSFDVPPVFYKFVDSDGNFSNFTDSPEGIQLSQKGTYKLDLEKSQYQESVTIADIQNGIVDNGVNTFKITLSEEKNLFTIEGEVITTFGKIYINETWRRIDDIKILKPSQKTPTKSI